MNDEQRKTFKRIVENGRIRVDSMDALLILIVQIETAAFERGKLANHHLKMTGSYACFDEPGSVRIAREILAEADALPHVLTDLIGAAKS